MRSCKNLINAFSAHGPNVKIARKSRNGPIKADTRVVSQGDQENRDSYQF